jgi:hypothetical protein
MRFAPSPRPVGPASKTASCCGSPATAFDVLITVDRNLEYQQSFKGLSLAVIVIHASSNDIIALRPLMPAVVDLIPQAKPGAVTPVGGK